MTPNTTVTLYATPFDISNKYVVAANSPGEALAIVSSYPSKVYTDCYWQRDNDFVFRANGNINEVEQYNYCVYLNNGRYNFAFITECDYVNDAMTLVHLATDPWLNYAGDYVFHDSPMIRCHPPNDTDEYLNNIPEPVTVGYFEMEVAESRGYIADDIDSFCLMTSIKASNVNVNTGVDHYWNGVLALAQQTSVADLMAWSRTIQGGYTKIGPINQPNTCVADRTVIRNIVAAFMQNGFTSALVGAYHVPVSLWGTHNGVDMDSLPIETLQISITTDGGYTKHWAKIRTAPQFNMIMVNCAGNVREIPAEYLFNVLYRKSPIIFMVLVDPSSSGNFTARCLSLNGIAYQYLTCSSPSWDRVPLVAHEVDANIFKQSILNQALNIGNAAFDMVDIASDKWGLLQSGIGGTLSKMGRTAYNAMGSELQNAINTEIQVKNSNIVLGGLSTSMATYNQNNPLLNVFKAGPGKEETERLNIYFGTYGYSFQNKVLPISFKTLPHWNYYQTFNASIEGSKVPQRYLMQIIQRFNAGIFVFNSVADYKDFSKALDNHY